MSQREPGFDAVTRPEPLGMRLVQLGHLKAQDIPKIELAQRQSRLRFGDTAVQLGLVSRKALDQALSGQFHLPSLPDWARGTELVVATQPGKAAAEGIRTLRTRLAVLWRHQEQPSCLSVVSAQPGEGRSFMAANLALAFAQTHRRTLLIDMDLRRPRQHQIFRLSNRQGLSALLSGRGTGREVQRIDGYEALSVLPSGPLPPSPPELLAGPALSQLIDHLRRHFDLIVLDTPSWSAGADALTASAQAGQALLVSAPRRATQAATDGLIAALRQGGIGLVGAVVNGV